MITFHEIYFGEYSLPVKLGRKVSECLDGVSVISSACVVTADSPTSFGLGGDKERG